MAESTIIIKLKSVFSVTPPSSIQRDIKRVIAKGGQTVDIDYATSTVYVDGVACSGCSNIRACSSGIGV